jgi:short-subunit dehydrogenase
LRFDLANLSSVRDCADKLLKKGEPFDVVIANAGVMATPFGPP